MFRIDRLQGVTHAGILAKRDRVEAASKDSADNRWTTDLFSPGRGAVDGLNVVRFGESSRWGAYDSEDRIGDGALNPLCIGHRRGYVFVAEEVGDVLIIVVEIALKTEQDFV